MDQAQQKQELRQKIRAEMANTPEDYFLSSGRQICQKIIESPIYQRSQVIFCFVSHGKEPCTFPLLQQALDDCKTLCVPLCFSGGRMEARQITSLRQLSPGAYGIPEPLSSAPLIAPSQIQLALIPCLAATGDGRRLGKGGGYYDRFLAHCPADALLLCPARFILRHVPTEPHDIPLPSVITE